jgi:AcrR family transcriptional regulator
MLAHCAGQYTTVWCGLMTKRLAAQDWTDFALKTLARVGFDALKADVLARKLGVSRGSFYWHFTDLDDFHARVIEHWRQTSTEAVISDLERYQSLEERLEVLLRRALGHHNALEMRMRAWADNNAEAAQAVRDMDRRRRDYMERLLVDAGIAPTLAATRVQLLYWTYLGAALSQVRPTRDQLDRIVTELKQIVFRGPAAATENPRRRRLSRSGRNVHSGW